MNNKEYFEALAEQAEKNGGKIHIPMTPPEPTTAAQTDEYLKLPDNLKNRLNKYLSVLNEGGGVLVPYLFAEVNKLQEKEPGDKYNLWSVLDRISQGDADAIAILKRARENLEKAKILESKEGKAARPLPAIKTYGILNDKVNHDLICSQFLTREIDGQMYMSFETDQASKEEKKSKERVIVFTVLSYEGPEPLTSKKLSGYDNSVYNALSTLHYYYQQKYPGEPSIITPQEIWRTMNGITDQSKIPSPAQLKKVCSSIDKMRFTRVFLDISEELQKHNLVFKDERLVNGVIDTYYLKADRGHFVTEKGRVIDAYKIENEPILYSYNKAKDRVLFVPFDLLNTAAVSGPKGESGTGNEGHTIEIREYLLTQIMLMYNKERNKRILFKTLYEKTGLEQPAQRIDRSKYSTDNAYKTGIKKEAAKDREKIFEILEAWKAKKFIKGFAKVGAHPITGVDIELMPNPPKVDTESASIPAKTK